MAAVVSQLTSVLPILVLSSNLHPATRVTTTPSAISPIPLRVARGLPPTRLPPSLWLSWGNITARLFAITALKVDPGSGSQEGLEVLHTWESAGGRQSERVFLVVQEHLPPSASHGPSQEASGLPRPCTIKSRTFVQFKPGAFTIRIPYTVSRLYSFTSLFISWLPRPLFFPARSSLCFCAFRLPYGTGIIFQPGIPSPLSCN